MNNKNLKEQFETFRPSVDEAGWERLDRDPALRRNRRWRKLRKFLPLGAACVTIAAVAVVVCIALPRTEHAASTECHTPPPTPSAPMTTAAADHPATAQPVRPSAAAAVPTRESNIAATAPAQAATENNSRGTAALTADRSTGHVSPKPLPPVPTVSPLSPLPPLRLAELEPKAADTDIEDSGTDTVEPAPTPATEPARLFLAPNAFTPNNDGINDLFLLQCNEPCTLFELDIYTRNGENVFNTKHIDQGWNGKRLDSGDPLPQAVYVYVVKYRTADGKSGSEHGQILLIR